MTKPRARDLGIPFVGTPGRYNSITDVAGLTVGYATIIEGSSIRTGVTIVHPRGKEDHTPVYAGLHAFNGNGEVTGAAWIEEGGLLEGPIGITNSHSVGVVRDAIIVWQLKNNAMYQRWSLPVVGETADGWLNDMNGLHVREQHVFQALDNATSGQIEEGSVGGGTGMVCYEFKGGTGTSSRQLKKASGGWTIGALVQANFGRRHQFTLAGIPMGKNIPENPLWPASEDPFLPESGSLIVILATDAPLLPHQLKRVAKRATLGMARTGSMGGNGSGDIFIAFSTANAQAAYGDEMGLSNVQTLSNDVLDPIFASAALVTEEAIINSMVAADTMTGHNGVQVIGLPHDRVRKLARKFS